VLQGEAQAGTYIRDNTYILSLFVYMFKGTLVSSFHYKIANL